MPNKPRTDNPNRVVRVEDALWSKVVALAETRGISASEVVRDALRRYVRRPPK